jgi:hypothetical protein
MRLNLGCGKAQLPTYEGNPLTKHLTHLPQTAYTEQWVNVDAVDIDGVDYLQDLFYYPWHWADDTVDEIWCSHIVEHIPHTAEYHSGVASPELKRMAKLDGWYAFFYEAWRIMKPDALLHIVAPYAWSGAGMIDPTHTRYILPGTFGYFKPDEAAPFDYGIIPKFEAVDNPIMRIADMKRLKQIIGDAQPTSEILEMVAWMGVDLIDEMYLCLRAVK